MNFNIGDTVLLRNGSTYSVVNATEEEIVLDNTDIYNADGTTIGDTGFESGLDIVENLSNTLEYELELQELNDEYNRAMGR